MQKVNYVPRTQVLKLIEIKAGGMPITGKLDWGKVADKQQLIDAVNSLKRTEDDHIDLSRLSQCIQSLHTEKLLGGANRALIGLWAIIKMETVRR